MTFPKLTPNLEGVVTNPVTGAGNFSVDATGHLTLPGNEGAISPDGRFVVIGGGSGAGSPPIFLFLVRR